MIKNINNNFIFVDRKTLPLDISLELKRCELYLDLQKKFIDSSCHIFGKNIFSLKKNYDRTLKNLLAGWFFYMYMSYDFTKDPFFPQNYKNKDYIKNVIKDYCKIDKNLSSDIIQTKLNILLNKLDIYYTDILVKLDQFITVENNFDIIKINNSKIDNIVFYKLVIKNYKSLKLKNFLDTIIITKSKYNNLKCKFTGKKNEFNKYLFVIILRYQLLGSNNNQLAILPNIISKMKKDFNVNFELFGSTINSTLNNYCSLYYDIEKYFGSCGSFFNLIPLKGLYFCNPPFQKNLIEKCIYRLIEFLSLTNELCFFITIPIWDLEGKETMENLNLPNNNNKINYGDFEIINFIKKSQYFKGLRMISKNEFTYYDHNFNLYKNKTIQNTYVIILSNFNNNYISKINEYNFKE